jgi:hypothetical protein
MHLKRYEGQYKQHRHLWKLAGKDEYVDWQARPNTVRLKQEIMKLKAIRKQSGHRDHKLRKALINKETKARSQPLTFTPGNIRLAKQLSSIPGFTLQAEVRSPEPICPLTRTHRPSNWNP